MTSTTRDPRTSTHHRRTVLRAGTWAVPVIAVAQAAPAFALSPCAAVTLSYGAAGATFTSGSAGGVTVTLENTPSGAATSAANNRTVGDLSTFTNALRFYSPVTDNTSQIATFKFSQPVANLKFTLLDIDSALATNAVGTVTTKYFDTVTVAALASYTATIVNPANVVGNGSSTPLQPANNNTAVSDTTNGGNVAIEFALSSSISQFSLTYAQTGQVVGNVAPHIGISQLTYRPVLC